MAVVDLHNIKKSYGITEVLKGFSMSVNEGERAALIGANGCGKTTVFRIIAGLEPYSKGSLSLKNGIDVGYLSQMPDIDSDKTLQQELETVFADVIAMEEKMSELEQKISSTGENVENDGEERVLEQLMQEYSELQHRFENKDGYGYSSEIRKVAIGLGFEHEELGRNVSKFSGGEKTRLGLAKLLLAGPDLLLLDEPTNHLDIPSLQWLENYLGEYDGTVIIISHDRYFLDEVVDRIIELKQGRNEVYHGNYSYYLEERKRRYEQRLRTYENQQKKIVKMEKAIEKLRRWGRQGDNEKFFKRAKSMEKQLEKIDKVEKPVLGGEKMGLDFEIDRRSGDEVLIIKDLSFSFSDEQQEDQRNEQIIKDLEFSLYWGQKAAVIGDNGTGKTSLLKIVVGQLFPDNGDIKIGSNVKLGYYSQEFSGFKESDDLITAFRREVPMREGEARDALAAFLFTEDEVFKRVENLSGGEKSRLRLLQLMNGNYNFLILDEPTNHLDLPSREVLEDALQNYSGTLLVVSHDRYFLNEVIDYTFELDSGQLTKYYGNYDYYRSKKEELEGEEDKQEESEAGQKDNYYFRRKREERKKRKQKRRLQDLEADIIKLEERKEELEQEMAAPENHDDFDLLKQLKQKYEKTNNKLEQLYQEWEGYVSEQQ